MVEELHRQKLEMEKHEVMKKQAEDLQRQCDAMAKKNEEMAKKNEMLQEELKKEKFECGTTKDTSKTASVLLNVSADKNKPWWHSSSTWSTTHGSNWSSRPATTVF